MLFTPIRASQPDLSVKLDAGGVGTQPIATVATPAKFAHESDAGITALSMTIRGIYVRQEDIHQLSKQHHVAIVIRLGTMVKGQHMSGETTAC